MKLSLDLRVFLGEGGNEDSAGKGSSSLPQWSQCRDASATGSTLKARKVKCECQVRIN